MATPLDIPLGKQVEFPRAYDRNLLKAVPWENPDLLESPEVDLNFDEFTSLCPITKQPDFGRIHISYKPRNFICESKSLKLYLGSFRNFGCFQEKITSIICNDFVHVVRPHHATITTDFNSRGGVTISCSITWEED